MTKALRKNTRRSISGSLGRYIAILLIIMLGVAFLTGLRDTRPIMSATETAYVKNTKLYDLRLISTIGFDADDVAAVQRALYEMIDQASERWYLKNEIPTMGAVRGRIVLATRFDDKLQVGSDHCGLYFGWTDQGDRTVLTDPTADSVINGRETLCVQDRYNYDVDDKITAIHTCLDNSRAADDTFFLNFTSTSGSGAVGHPKEYAKDINLDLYAYEWEAGKAYGVVIVDFGPKKIAEKIYGTNFQ